MAIENDNQNPAEPGQKPNDSAATDKPSPKAASSNAPSSNAPTEDTNQPRKRRRILIGSQLGDDENRTVKARKAGESDVAGRQPTAPQQPPDTASDSTVDQAASDPEAAEIAGSEKAGSEKAGSERTGSERTGSERTGSERTGSERTGSGKAGGEVASEEALARDDLQTLPRHLAPASTDDNIDDQLKRLMTDVSVDDLMASTTMEQELELDSRIKATVDKVHNEHVFFNLKGRFVGIASIRQFKSPPDEGAMMDVIVKDFNQDEGFYEVLIPGASMEVADWSDLNQGDVIEAKITGSNTGGLECIVNGIRGFIPASQIEIHRVESFGDYVNHKLQCVVTEVNPRRKRLVLSHRAIVEREQEARREELLASLEPGLNCEGRVTKLMDFGAFVDIGGIEGLVHISKLSWDRVGHPREVLEVGETISVKIEKVNQQTGKISLSYRDTQEHPWKRVDEKYPEGSTVTGTVSKLAQFGAFVKLEPGVEGLVHISEIAHHRVLAVGTHLKVGGEVTAKVLSVDPQEQKMGLSIKALVDRPEEPQRKGREDKSEEEAHRPEAIVAKTDQPLKGGTSRSSGGEKFGLKW